jgi:tetratricopeptide (TPR) repeat protein
VPLTDGGADVVDAVAPDPGAEPEVETPATTPSEAAEEDTSRSWLLDDVVTRALWVVGATVILFSAFFAYNVYAQGRADRLSSPALVTIDNAQKLVAQNPGNLALRIQLAQAFGAAGMFNDAKAQLAVVIKADGKNVAAYETLAQIALLQEDYKSAKSHLNKILELTGTGDFQNVNQRRDTAYFHLGEIALIEKKYEDAVGYFKAALRIRRDASDTYLRLAQAYVGLNFPDEAMENLDIALAFDPKLPEAHYEKGRLLVAKGDKVGAAWEFRAALDGAPESPEAQGALEALGTYKEWYGKAETAFAGAQLPAALDAVRIARAMDPTSYDAAMLHGRILEKMEDFAGAADAYAIAVRVKPGDKPASEALTRSTEASQTKGAK